MNSPWPSCSQEAEPVSQTTSHPTRSSVSSGAESAEEEGR